MVASTVTISPSKVLTYSKSSNSSMRMWKTARTRSRPATGRITVGLFSFDVGRHRVDHRRDVTPGDGIAKAVDGVRTVSHRPTAGHSIRTSGGRRCLRSRGRRQQWGEPFQLKAPIEETALDARRIVGAQHHRQQVMPVAHGPPD